MKLSGWYSCLRVVLIHPSGDSLRVCALRLARYGHKKAALRPLPLAVTRSERCSVLPSPHDVTPQMLTIHLKFELVLCIEL